MRRWLLVLASGAAGLCVSLAAATSRAQAPAGSPAAALPIEAPQPARSLTIAEALAYARGHQPAIHAALSRVAARMAAADVPGGQWLPTVGVTAQLFGMTANNTTATYAA